MRTKFWLFFSFVLAVSLLGSFTAFAASTTVEGKINGFIHAMNGYKCPLENMEAHIALEPDLVLVTPDNTIYVIANLKKEIKSRYLCEDLKVTGTVDKEKEIIIADNFEVKKDGKWKTVWSVKDEKKAREFYHHRQMGSDKPVIHQLEMMKEKQKEKK
ncbi:MAG: hypothetical protein HYW01_05295 [Deltaproteobacteria bacterium]|nr:hypothetical protein [Deltaproteobacteria bacterium]